MTVEIKCHLFKTNPSENEVHFLVFLKMRLVLCRSLLNIESIILSKSLREIESAAILFCYGPIVYYISGGGGLGDGLGGWRGVQFLKRVDFGGSVLKMYKV